MRQKKGMTQETLVKMVLALILLAILLYLAYTYILKGGEKTAKLGECMSTPGRTCVAKAADCSGQAFLYGCPQDNSEANKNNIYCCITG